MKDGWSVCICQSLYDSATIVANSGEGKNFLKILKKENVKKEEAYYNDYRVTGVAERSQ